MNIKEFENKLKKIGIITDDRTIRKMFDVYSLSLNHSLASEICEITGYSKVFVSRALIGIKKML